MQTSSVVPIPPLLLLKQGVNKEACRVDEEACRVDEESTTQDLKAVEVKPPPTTLRKIMDRNTSLRAEEIISACLADPDSPSPSQQLPPVNKGMVLEPGVMRSYFLNAIHLKFWKKISSEINDRYESKLEVSDPRSMPFLQKEKAAVLKMAEEMYLHNASIESGVLNVKPTSVLKLSSTQYLIISKQPDATLSIEKIDFKSKLAEQIINFGRTKETNAGPQTVMLILEKPNIMVGTFSGLNRVVPKKPGDSVFCNLETSKSLLENEDTARQLQKFINIVSSHPSSIVFQYGTDVLCHSPEGDSSLLLSPGYTTQMIIGDSPLKTPPENKSFELGSSKPNSTWFLSTCNGPPGLNAFKKESMLRTPAIYNCFLLTTAYELSDFYESIRKGALQPTSGKKVAIYRYSGLVIINQQSSAFGKSTTNLPHPDSKLLVIIFDESAPLDEIETFIKPDEQKIKYTRLSDSEQDSLKRRLMSASDEIYTLHEQTASKSLSKSEYNNLVNKILSANNLPLRNT